MHHCPPPQFGQEQGRQYDSPAEFMARREVFQANYDSMLQHNARYGELVKKRNAFMCHIFVSKLVKVTQFDNVYLLKIPQVRGGGGELE